MGLVIDMIWKIESARMGFFASISCQPTASRLATTPRHQRHRAGERAFVDQLFHSHWNQSQPVFIHAGFCRIGREGYKLGSNTQQYGKKLAHSVLSFVIGSLDADQTYSRDLISRTNRSSAQFCGPMCFSTTLPLLLIT